MYLCNPVAVAVAPFEHCYYYGRGRPSDFSSRCISRIKRWSQGENRATSFRAFFTYYYFFSSFDYMASVRLNTTAAFTYASKTYQQAGVDTRIEREYMLGLHHTRRPIDCQARPHTCIPSIPPASFNPILFTYIPLDRKLPRTA